MDSWTEKAKAINFDRLDMLVSERIAALKLYADSLGGPNQDAQAHEAICRDLIFPAVGLLANFIESVEVGSQQVGDKRTP